MMKVLTATVLALAIVGQASAAGLVTSTRPMPRPDYIGAKDGPRLNTRGIAGAYGIPKNTNGAAVRSGDGASWQSCPC